MKVIYWNSYCWKKCLCGKALVRCFNTLMLTAFSRFVCNRELSLLVKLTQQHHPVGSHLWWWLIRFEVQRKRFAPDVWKIKALPRERCCCYLVFQGSDQRSWNSSPSRTLDVLPNLQPNSVSVLQWTDILLVSQITPAVFRGLLLHATSHKDILPAGAYPVLPRHYITSISLGLLWRCAAFNWLLGCHYNFK